jgi:hypothetical protein
VLLAAVDTDDRLADEVFDEHDIHAPRQRADIGADAGESGKANGIDTIHGVLRRDAAWLKQQIRNG